MLVSDYSHIVYRTLKVSLAILVSALGVVWINQQAFNQYWMLHFHRETPWANTDAHWWLYGGTVGDALTSSEDAFLKVLSGEHDAPPPVAPVVVKSAGCPAATLPTQPAAPPPAAGEAPVLISILGPSPQVPLPAGKKVLMIGDSMMEGVAPQLIAYLKKDHQVGGVNLSKRSTGLAYPSFFNWPKTTENALAHESDIGLLVVFMGPNDPWDMPSEQKQHRHFLKFKSAAWESEYRQRIDSILTSAQQRNIPVIWALPPVMRKRKLNAGVSYLDTLYASEVISMGGVTVNVNHIFGYKDNHYSPDAVIKGKKVRVRADDGIHYSPTGQKLIAQAILAKIQFPKKDKE